MSQDLNPLPAALAEIERSLGRLQPARSPTAALDRDRLLYEAGLAAGGRAGRRRVWLWQGVCGVLVLGVMGLALVPRERVVEKVVVRALAASVAKPMVEVTAQPEVVAMTDEGLVVALLKYRQGWRESLDVKQTGGGATSMPALKPGDGLDALPAWQKRAATGTRM